MARRQSSLPPAPSSEPSVAGHVTVVLTQRVRDTRRSTLTPRATPGRRGVSRDVGRYRVATALETRGSLDSRSGRPLPGSSPSKRLRKGQPFEAPGARPTPDSLALQFLSFCSPDLQGWPFPNVARAHSERAVRSADGGTRSMRGKWLRMEVRARASSTTERESS